MAQFTLYKLIILYMLSRVDHPLTNSQISEFILDREYTDYFKLQQTLSEMVETHLIDMEATHRTSYYRISESGSSTLDFFVDKVSPEIRAEVDEYLKQHDFELREDVSAIADYSRLTVGGFAVHMLLREQRSPVIDLTVTVPSERAAQCMCEKWREKCHEVYEKVVDLLL